MAFCNHKQETIWLFDQSFSSFLQTILVYSTSDQYNLLLKLTFLSVYQHFYSSVSDRSEWLDDERGPRLPFSWRETRLLQKISFSKVEVKKQRRKFSSSWCPFTTMIQGVGGDLFRCSIFGGEGGENWKSVTFVFVLWCYAHIFTA